MSEDLAHSDHLSLGDAEFENTVVISTSDVVVRVRNDLKSPNFTIGVRCHDDLSFISLEVHALDETVGMTDKKSSIAQIKGACK